MLQLHLTTVLLLGIATALAIPFPKEELRLIKTKENFPAKWMTKSEILDLVKSHENFIDVTGHNFPDAANKYSAAKDIPTTIRYNSTVTALLQEIDTQRMETFIQSFSNFTIRHYQSPTGLLSQQWLFQVVNDSLAGYSGLANVSEFHHSWPQRSIIARIEGSEASLRDEVIILGAHQDTINRLGGSLPAPGADDNASGSAVLLEVLRILIQSQFSPKRSIEFQWYAAEEVGLLGSGDIARNYYNSQREVVAMLNYDVPGFRGPSSEDLIGIYTDFTDPLVSAFLRQLVSAYSNWGWKNMECGYGCSDHASWHNYGYPASHPGVTVWNPSMHTEQDTIDKIGWDQLKEFTKVALSAAVEIAEPSA